MKTGTRAKSRQEANNAKKKIELVQDTGGPPVPLRASHGVVTKTLKFGLFSRPLLMPLAPSISAILMTGTDTRAFFTVPVRVVAAVAPWMKMAGWRLLPRRKTYLLPGPVSFNVT